MKQLVIGAIAMAFAVTGLCFLRYWQETRDRLFALFSLAFFVLAANRIGLALFEDLGAKGDHFYWVRFAAFSLILVAIFDKNRSMGTRVASQLKRER